MTFAAKTLSFIIRFYQIALSPLTARHCRYHPTCSAYGLAALGRFGAVRGVWLTACRICRCHPFHSGGFDPVPEYFFWFRAKTSCTTVNHDTASKEAA